MKKEIMKSIKLILILLVLPFSGFSADITLNPTNFEANIGNVTDNSIVSLEAGNYTISSAILAAWSSGVKSNVTYRRIGGGVVKMDASAVTNMPTLAFNGWSNLTIKNIEFVNIEIEFNNCSDSTMDNLSIYGQEYTIIKTNYFAVRILGGSNCVMKNSFIEWTFTGVNGRGIKVLDGTNHQLLNNTITGRLVGGINIKSSKKGNNSNNPVTNHIIDGGLIRRDISSGEEDHGIYILNISDVLVKNVDIRGFTDNAAGQGIKIKGANRIEITNCDFTTSGIIIRVAKNWLDANDHIWIHNNRLHDGKISSYTQDDPGMSDYLVGNDGFTINNSAVIENNILYDGEIKALQEDSNSFNALNDLANKAGGVYNNQSVIDLKTGINVSGNTGLNASVIAVSGITVSPTSASIKEDASDSIDLTETVLQSNASKKIVNWSSSNTAIASVSSTGYVTGVSAGIATITASTVDGSFIASSTITVTAVALSVKGSSFEKIKIYPNPVENEINIKLGFGNVLQKIVLTDMGGRILINKSFPNDNNREIKIDLTEYNLTQGLYLLNIIEENQTNSIKIIKH